METDSYIDISAEDEPKYYGEVEIHKIMDAPEEIITSEDLDNQSTHQLEDTQYYGESEEEEQDTEEKNTSIISSLSRLHN